MNDHGFSQTRHTGRTAAAWLSQHSERERSYRMLVTAMLPAAAILIAAAGVLARLLAT